MPTANSRKPSTFSSAHLKYPGLILAIRSRLWPLYFPKLNVFILQIGTRSGNRTHHTEFWRLCRQPWFMPWYLKSGCACRIRTDDLQLMRMTSFQLLQRAVLNCVNKTVWYADRHELHHWRPCAKNFRYCSEWIQAEIQESS